jgi:hypothetical protein
MLNQLDLAQQYSNEDPILPLKTNRSVLFGKDIIINDLPNENQKRVAVCSAFNGWLYAAVWSRVDGYTSTIIMKSENGGLNWNLFKECGANPLNEILTSFNIVACGNSISNLKLFFGKVSYDTIYHRSVALVGRYNGITGVTEVDLLDEQDEQIYGLAISNDYNYPATNSNPGSLGILYSIQGVKDSIIFRSSSDGGMTLSNRKVVAVSSHHFNKVALNYGVCPSYNSGRYFAAWEIKSDPGSNFYHIYTAHTNPDITGSFTPPVCLDSLDASAINKCKNPSIACQYGIFNNDSSNLTEVVLAEKYNTANNDYDVIGFYNRRAATSDHFENFNIASTANNEIQPSINFDAFDSSFMVTYFDSTIQKLPFIKNNCNLLFPNTWQVLSPGYNDSSNILRPYPQVISSYFDHLAVTSWIGMRSGDNGKALFDSPSSTYTGGSNENGYPDALQYDIFPNPCSSKCNIQFELKFPQTVKIKMFTTMGQELTVITDQLYMSGKHILEINVSPYPPGSYIFTIVTNRNSTNGKIIIIR